MIESCKRVKSWRGLVNKVARKFIKEPFTGACEVVLVFKLKRRNDHFNSKGEVKNNAPKQYLVKRNDLDKLVRSTLDALSGVAYLDDCQVIKVIASKQYANSEEEIGANICINEII